MIHSIEVKNFKSLKDIQFQPKSLNLLMGLNGMGKSSFIQTLLILRQSKSYGLSKIRLNGAYAAIGNGKDAIYQDSMTDKIDLRIDLSNADAEMIQLPCSLSYQSDSDILDNLSEWPLQMLERYSLFNDKFQYLEAERLGPKTDYAMSYNDVVDAGEIGCKGEYAVHFLNTYGNSLKIPTLMLHQGAKSNILLHQTAAWLSEISPGIKLNTTEIPGTNRIVLDYQFAKGAYLTNGFKPRNVGFGISYILPVIVSLLSFKKDKILIIENPESHIHPRGQAAMGRLLALAAASGMQLFIETHSDHIVNGIRVAVKEKKIDKNEVNIAYFDKKTTDMEQFTTIQKIRVDENGELSEYPKDFMDEWNNQLLKLI